MDKVLYRVSHLKYIIKTKKMKTEMINIKKAVRWNWRYSELPEAKIVQYNNPKDFVENNPIGIEYASNGEVKAFWVDGHKFVTSDFISATKEYIYEVSNKDNCPNIPTLLKELSFNEYAELIFDKNRELTELLVINKADKM